MAAGNYIECKWHIVLSTRAHSLPPSLPCQVFPALKVFVFTTVFVSMHKLFEMSKVLAFTPLNN